MSKVWRFAPHDESHVRRLCGELRVSPLMAQLLVARGLGSAAAANDFLNATLKEMHDPTLLPGIPEAADRVVSAIKNKRQITIYGDYDVDGVTSTSLLWHCFTLAGAQVQFHIPDRQLDGYGINLEAIERLAEENKNQLVISVDCGITSVAEAARAKELGLELIITDHHNFASEFPDAAVLVHPRLPDSQYPFGDLCGVGVAFKLAWAVCQLLGDGGRATPRMRNFLLSAVGLTAIGTIADVVPLRGENRIIVRYGLSGLKHKCSPGLTALMKVIGIENQKVLTSEDIGFKVAPRINAAGRLKQARLAVDLLTTDDPKRAEMLAACLDQLNKDRQTIERRILKQAKEMVEEHPEWDDHNILVLSDPKWHSGVIGIVANRVAEHFEKPAIMIAVDSSTQIGQGSGRTFAGLNLHNALTNCASHLETFGGHHAAAGLKIKTKNIDAFREELNAFVTENHEVREEDLEINIDAEVRLADLTYNAVTELERIGPFGAANPTPILASSNVMLAQPPKKIGEAQNHLSMQVKQLGTVLRSISWGRGEWADEIAQLNGPFSICYKPKLNEYKGYRSVQLELLDWKPANENSGAQ